MQRLNLWCFDATHYWKGSAATCRSVRALHLYWVSWFGFLFQLPSNSFYTGFLFSIYLFLYMSVELHSGKASRKDSCLTSAHVLRLSPRQWGYRSGQRGGEGERPLPAHHRQSTDTLWTVTQAGAARLSISGNASLCDNGDALYSKLSHVHCSKITQPAVLWDGHQSVVQHGPLSKGFHTLNICLWGVFNLHTLPGNLLQKPNPCRKMEKRSEASRRLWLVCTVPAGLIRPLFCSRHQLVIFLFIRWNIPLFL